MCVRACVRLCVCEEMGIWLFTASVTNLLIHWLIGFLTFLYLVPSSRNLYFIYMYSSYFHFSTICLAPRKRLRNKCKKIQQTGGSMIATRVWSGSNHDLVVRKVRRAVTNISMNACSRGKISARRHHPPGCVAGKSPKNLFQIVLRMRISTTGFHQIRVWQRFCTRNLRRISTPIRVTLVCSLAPGLPSSNRGFCITCITN